MIESPVKLLYIEDHPVMIRGFRDIFRSGRDSVVLSESAANVGEAITSISPDRFDIIVLDLFLGEADPLVNIRQLTAHFTRKPIIVYTGHTGIVLMKEAFQQGIRAWILKSAGKPEIKDTIFRVACGETLYPQELLRLKTTSGDNTPGVIPSFRNLHPDKEQLAILNWLCEGHTTHEIAKNDLKVTLSTVEKKLQVMRELAEVKTNCELVVLYLKLYHSNR
ncbi:MAG TPA: response regulator transcription factor [Bacteroidales bacterium]|nr:response regulator transcription factor [Bacteroidales bacterium]HPS51839.1 response regulator transcription factor [Bacteroidales bacterium]